AEKFLPRYTLKDYESWEGDWELIEGIPYALASPSFEHQRIVGKLFRYIDEYLEKNCSMCVVGIDTDYVISEDTVLRPDVFVVCEKVVGRLVKPPELVFEVVSEGTREKDEKLKRLLYQREGIPYFVIVYPGLRKARIFKLTDGEYRKVFDAVDDLYTFELSKCSLSLDFSRVWE
ncbi:Uma2 family endonuclease, partial [Hydrogenivirga sp.]